MRRRARKARLVGPWRKIHGAVWVIGLVILAVRDWWWPGILVLVAISLLLEAALMQSVPQAFEEADKEGEFSPSEAAPPTPPPVSPEYRTEYLPTVCPSCGGPIRGHEAKWTGPKSANCPYCGANLPMGKD